jgi:hypothetical protein
VNEVGDKFVVRVNPASLFSQEDQERVNEKTRINGQMRIEPVIISRPCNPERFRESHAAFPSSSALRIRISSGN